MSAEVGPGEASPETVAGERSISSVNQGRSLQSRISNVLAMGLMSTLGVGLLGWYYAHTFSHQGEAKRAAQAASRNQAGGDMPLPSLGRIDPPAPTPVMAQVLGSPPPPPAMLDPGAGAAQPSPSQIPGGGPPAKSAWELALERRLAGPVSKGPGVSSETTELSAVPPHGTDAQSLLSAPAADRLGALLKVEATPAASPRVLPTERLLLPKGTFIDCTLETAIDSTLPGMTTCITATDTFGVDGSTVLIERGSKLVGETRGSVEQGQARIFVLWAEARTPTGVIVPLASPGTDELGRSGLPGEVNRHFFERFGAAILISVINGAVQGTIASQSNGSTLIYNPSASQDIGTEVLKSTVNIPPTVTKPQGDRIQVFVAHDLDFRSVYELKAAER